MIDLLAALALLVIDTEAPKPVAATEVSHEAHDALKHAGFLVGRWAGTGMGGDVQESWSEPIGGQMVGHFTYSRDGKPVFYEILLLRPNENGGLEMLVKHFNADFTAWEEKGEWVTFKADRTAANDLRFKGLTLAHSDGVLTATVMMKRGDGEPYPVPFVMTRVD